MLNTDNFELQFDFECDYIFLTYLLEISQLSTIQKFSYKYADFITIYCEKLC